MTPKKKKIPKAVREAARALAMLSRKNPTPAQVAASKRNGKRGGRPRKKPLQKPKEKR